MPTNTRFAIAALVDAGDRAEQLAKERKAERYLYDEDIAALRKIKTDIRGALEVLLPILNAKSEEPYDAWKDL